MAGEIPQEPEYYEPEEYQGTSHDFLQSVLIMAPSWLGSAIIHAVIILVLCQVPWGLGQDRDKTFEANLKEPPAEDIEEQEEPEPPKIEDDPELTDDSLPAEDVAFIPEVEMEQLDIDVPGFNEDEPDEEPPLAIAKLALGDEGAAGHFHGIYGSRGGRGRKKSLMRFGGSRRSEKSVDDALGWLARAQEEDGHWDAQRWGGGNVDAAVTGLALLAFLGHGETDREGKYRRNVYKALEWLERFQAPDGSFKARFYTQGICTMAASEAYGLSRNPRWKSMAQKAVNFCVQNQNPEGGWDYGGNNPGRVDTSVTGWVVMGVKSGVASGLDVPPEAISRIKNWLKWSVNAQGLTGYAGEPGKPSGGSPAMTAVATLGRQFMGWKRDHPDMTKALAYLDKSGVTLENMYYTYYATLVMFQAGGEFWNKWNKAFRDPLIDKQVTGRGLEFDGSWDTDISYGAQGGRVYSTAMSVFCLEIYYRFLPLLK
jgi:hypothetical protein